jgi:hypothetical protein
MQNPIALQSDEGIFPKQYFLSCHGITQSSLWNAALKCKPMKEMYVMR